MFVMWRIRVVLLSLLAAAPHTMSLGFALWRTWQSSTSTLLEATHSQRYGIAFITNCEDIAQASASQPGIKSFHLDKLQILEQTEGPKAVLVFQRLRRLTMRLNPPSTEERKHTLDFAEEPAPMMKKCRTLCAVPTDKSLDEMVPGSIG